MIPPPVISPATPDSPAKSYVSRAGNKLHHALHTFQLDPANLVCADLGCNAGGFTDCLLRHGAAKVFAVDTGYGMLDYSLRRNQQVVVMERTNALHVTLPEPVDLVVIDVAWTRQKLILPSARKLLRPSGQVITLIKPHYEAPKELLRNGVLPDEHQQLILTQTLADARSAGFHVIGTTLSPILGSKGNLAGKGNTEYLTLLALSTGTPATPGPVLSESPPTPPSKTPPPE